MAVVPCPMCAFTIQVAALHPSMQTVAGVAPEHAIRSATFGKYLKHGQRAIHSATDVSHMPKAASFSMMLCLVDTTASVLREMVSMPCSTKNAAKSGWSLGA